MAKLDQILFLTGGEKNGNKDRLCHKIVHKYRKFSTRNLGTLDCDYLIAMSSSMDKTSFTTKGTVGFFGLTKL
jgi:hypothetical protein